MNRFCQSHFQWVHNWNSQDFGFEQEDTVEGVWCLSCLALKTICVGPTLSTYYILWEGPLIRLIFEFETMQFISWMNSRTHRNSMPKSAREFCFKEKFQMPKAWSSSLKLFSTLPVQSPLSSLPAYHQAIYKGNLNVTLIIISSWIRTVSNEQAKY